MRKEKIEKIALAVVLALGLVYAYLNYLFLPKWALLQKQREQLRSREAYYQQLLSYQSNKEGLTKTIASLDSQAKELTAQIPADLDKPQIMVDIYTIAKLHAVNPQTLKFEQIQKKGNNQELAMSLTCSGKIDDILSFIKDLETTPLDKFALQSINFNVQNASSTPSTPSAQSTPSIQSTQSTQSTQNSLKTPDAESAAKNTAAGNSNSFKVMDATKVNSPATGQTGTVSGATQNQITGTRISPANPQTVQNQQADLPAQLSVELKMTAYANPIGTSDSSNKKPDFMFSQFGFDSIDKMFNP